MNQNQSRVIDIRLDGTEFAQIPSSACFLSPSLPGRMRVGGGEWTPKSTLCCGCKQSEFLLSSSSSSKPPYKAGALGSATLEFHYAAVYVCVCRQKLGRCVMVLGFDTEAVSHFIEDSG